MFRFLEITELIGKVTSKVPNIRKTSIIDSILDVRIIIFFKTNSNFRDNHIDPIYKINCRLADDVFNMINITREFRYTKSFGYQHQKNGTNETYFDGQVGDVSTNLSDFGATSGLLDGERVKLVHYLLPSVKSYGAIIFKSPPLTYVYNLFTLPFSTSIWIASIAFFALISFLLYGTAFWESLNRTVSLEH